MLLNRISDLRLHARSDSLLTVLTAVMTLIIFVFATLQAVGISVFHGLAIGGLLAIIGSMLFISDNPTALVLMSIALVANLAVFLLRIVLPLGLPPPHIGRRMVSHRGHSRNCGRSGRVQARPCHIPPNCRSDPCVPVDRCGLCNTVYFCRPIISRCDQRDSI